MDLIVKMLFCHMLGDYVLQIDFISKSKGENWYHLFVHCVLYVRPFYIIGCSAWELSELFFTHVLIDALKARYKKINYVQDQILHYFILALIIVLRRIPR